MWQDRQYYYIIMKIQFFLYILPHEMGISLIYYTVLKYSDERGIVFLQHRNQNGL